MVTSTGLLAAVLASSAALLWRLPPVPAGGATWRPPMHRWPLIAGAAVAVLSGSLLVGGARVALTCVGLGGVVLLVRRLVGRTRRRRSRQRTQLQVIELCDALGAELAAGIPATRAVELACTAEPTWMPVATTARLGGDVAAALRRLASDRAGGDGLLAVAAAWEVSLRSGAPLGDVLDRVAVALRDEQDARAEVTATLAPSRATAKMLTLLPLLGLGLGESMGAHPTGFLLGTPVGLGCLGGGVVLALVGVLWVEWLADQAEA